MYRFIFILIIRFIALVAGLCCLYLSLFLYENQQGKIQNSLENVWIRIDDLQKNYLARHIAFFRITATLVGSALSRLFGNNLVSIQSIGVCVCFAFASLNLVLLLFAISGSKSAYADAGGGFSVGILGFFEAVPQKYASMLVFLSLMSLLYGIHKIIWPVIEKPIYTLQRVGIVQRTKLLGLVGIALVGFALGATPGLVKDIVGKIVD